MSDFKKQYKKPPPIFGKTTIIKSRLAQTLQEERDKNRMKNLERNKKKKYLTLQNDNDTKKLMKWKAERARKKKAEESQKKPPFKIGIVHHRLFSPPNFLTNDATLKKKKVAQTDNIVTFKRGITKVTEKRLKAKAANAQKQKALTISDRNKIIRKLYTSGEKLNNDKIESTDQRKLFAPPDNKFNQPADLSSISLFRGVFIENSPSSKNILLHDKSTEKVSSTRVTKIDSELIISQLSLDEDKASNFFQNEQMEEKKHSPKYFKYLLRNERDRLQKLCDKWTAIQSQDDITEDIRYQINQAVGQTTMLIAEKFEQFYSLILHCKKNKDNVSEMKVTCIDLHGFWDMMYIQIKDCDSRFAKLEKLRVRNWQEQLSYTESASVRKKTIVKTLKQSSLRTSMLANQRKKKLAKMRDVKKYSLSNKINDIFTTPSISDKKATPVHKNLDVLYRRKLLQSRANKMYTSTPVPESITSSISNRISTPLITMKVSKFYRYQIIDSYQCVNAVQQENVAYDF